MRMKYTSVSLYILIATVSIVISNTKSVQPRRKYEIHLEDDLQTQYKEILSDRKKLLVDAVNTLKKGVHLKALQFVELNYKEILDHQNSEWSERIKIISNLTQIAVKDVIMINLVYEVACTSIIIDVGYERNSTEFEIFMGRNLDFVYVEFLNKLAYEAYYYKKGALVFISQEIAAYVGSINGVKVGQFTVSLNLRYNQRNILSSFKSLLKGYTNPAYILFDALKSSHNFTDVLELMTKSKITSPCYFILSGNLKNQGVIISRNMEEVVEYESIDVDNGKWFLVQTNSDRGEMDIRRNKAEQRLILMKKKNNSITYENIMEAVLSKYPTKNSETIYSTIQSPFKGGYLYSIYWGMETT